MSILTGDLSCSNLKTGAGAFGNPREFRCTGGEIVTLEALCDGYNNCTSGEDERNLICEGKLYRYIFGASVSEPHTSEFNATISVCLFVSYVMPNLCYNFDFCVIPE